MSSIKNVNKQLEFLIREYDNKILKKEDTSEINSKIKVLAQEFFNTIDDINIMDINDYQKITDKLKKFDSGENKIGLDLLILIDKKDRYFFEMIDEGFKGLTDDAKDVPKEFNKIPPNMIEAEVKAQIKETPPNFFQDGAFHFQKVLDEINLLKDELGGSPNFGDRDPELNIEDQQKTLFGRPVSGMKDFIRMKLKDPDSAALFWDILAKLFDVGIEETQYEKAHLYIQRFGLLIANKSHIFEILDTQDKERYGEFSEITGLIWHPDINGPGTEKTYIELVEQFLTTYFEDAKRQGPEKLKEYFEAFDGVCFEGKARKLEEYVLINSLEDIKEITSIIDVAASEPVFVAFDNVTNYIGINEGEVSTKRFFEEVKKSGIYDMEFRTDEGIKLKPTLKDAHLHVLKAIEYMSIEPYPIEELLEMELEIFKSSGIEMTASNFKAELEKREGSNGDEEFKMTLPEVEAFILKNFK